MEVLTPHLPPELEEYANTLSHAANQLRSLVTHEEEDVLSHVQQVNVVLEGWQKVEQNVAPALRALCSKAETVRTKAELTHRSHVEQIQAAEHNLQEITAQLDNAKKQSRVFHIKQTNCEAVIGVLQQLNGITRQLNELEKEVKALCSNDAASSRAILNCCRSLSELATMTHQCLLFSSSSSTSSSSSSSASSTSSSSSVHSELLPSRMHNWALPSFGQSAITCSPPLLHIRRVVSECAWAMRVCVLDCCSQALQFNYVPFSGSGEQELVVVERHGSDQHLQELLIAAMEVNCLSEFAGYLGQNVRRCAALSMPGSSTFVGTGHFRWVSNGANTSLFFTSFPAGTKTATITTAATTTVINRNSNRSAEVCEGVNAISETLGVIEGLLGNLSSVLDAFKTEKDTVSIHVSASGAPSSSSHTLSSLLWEDLWSREPIAAAAAAPAAAPAPAPAPALSDDAATVAITTSTTSIVDIPSLNSASVTSAFAPNPARASSSSSSSSSSLRVAKPVSKSSSACSSASSSPTASPFLSSSPPSPTIMHKLSSFLQQNPPPSALPSVVSSFASSLSSTLAAHVNNTSYHNKKEKNTTSEIAWSSSPPLLSHLPPLFSNFSAFSDPKFLQSLSTPSLPLSPSPSALALIPPPISAKAKEEEVMKKPLAEILLYFLFRPCIPTNVEELRCWQEGSPSVLARTQLFLDSLSQEIAVPPHARVLLLSFVFSIETHFCHKIRESALDDARTSIMDHSLTLWEGHGSSNSNSNNGRRNSSERVAVGDEKELIQSLRGVLDGQKRDPIQTHLEATGLLYPLQPPKISEGVHKLVNRLYQVAAIYLDWVYTGSRVHGKRPKTSLAEKSQNDEAKIATTALSSQSVWERAKLLLHTCRDMAWIFIAVAPLYGEKALRELVWGSLLFFNDCLYLSSHLSHLSSSLHLSLISLSCPDRSPAILADLVQPLLTLGKRVFKAQLQRQKESLLEELQKTAELFSAVDEDEQFELHLSLERAQLQLVPINKHCVELLTEKESIMIMMGLCNALAEKLVAIILSLTDISAESGSHLHEILCTVLEGLGVEGPGLFEGLKEYKEALVVQLRKSSHVRRLMQVRVVLRPEQSLAGLGTEIDKGQLKDLSSDQLTRLICAIWTETEKRAALLSRISRYAC